MFVYLLCLELFGFHCFHEVRNNGDFSRRKLDVVHSREYGVPSKDQIHYSSFVISSNETLLRIISPSRANPELAVMVATSNMFKNMKKMISGHSAYFPTQNYFLFKVQ